MSAPTWNDKFELADGLFFCFKIILSTSLKNMKQLLIIHE